MLEFIFGVIIGYVFKDVIKAVAKPVIDKINEVARSEKHEASK